MVPSGLQIAVTTVVHPFGIASAGAQQGLAHRRAATHTDVIHWIDLRRAPGDAANKSVKSRTAGVAAIL